MSVYFDKFSFDTHPLVSEFVPVDLGMVVVIPCYNEESVLKSLDALMSCDTPVCSVEVIVVVNCSEKSDQTTKDFQKETHESILEFSKTSKFKCHSILRTELPKKHAGVGLARKIGMDEAAFRLDQSGSSEKIIVCFDADSTCPLNYLIEIEDSFIRNPKANGASIYYEHPLEGGEFPVDVYSGIINYELFLRYYNLGLKFADLPYAYHTVGSSMACTSEAYQKQGGMNKRKAGEDFYFIHKIIALDHFIEINSTQVIPSPRISDRVPFGTGRAIGEWVSDVNEKKDFEYLTYDFNSFVWIKEFVALIPSFYHDLKKIEFIPGQLKPFLDLNGLEEAIANAKENSKDLIQFNKRMFVWFGPFKVMKLLHWLRDEVTENKSLENQVNTLLKSINTDEFPIGVKEQLIYLRKIEKEGLLL